MILVKKMKLPPFHLAIQVRDIPEAREFYKSFLGCTEGRSSLTSVDFNFYGHQLVCHLNPNIGKTGKIESFTNQVDNKTVPIPHFGLVLEMEQWETIAEKLKQGDIDFVIKPYIRFAGKAGEQATLFFTDPSGNAIELKAFKDISQLFRAY